MHYYSKGFNDHCRDYRVWPRQDCVRHNLNLHRRRNSCRNHRSEYLLHG